MPRTDLSAMTVEVSHRFVVDIQKVWALLSDVERMAGLSPEHYEAHWSDGGPRVGATFLGKNRRGSSEWEVMCHITECEPPRRLVWTVMEPENPSSTWSYSLKATEGATEVVQRFQHGPNVSGITVRIGKNPENAEKIISRRTEILRSDMKLTLTNAEQLLRNNQ